MWSLPTRISSSCFPTIFFLGQFVSSSLYTTPVCSCPDASYARHTYFVISLDSTILLSSLTTNGPTHTVEYLPQQQEKDNVGTRAHFLCGSSCRSCSSSYSRTAASHASTRTPGTRVRACPNGQCYTLMVRTRRIRNATRKTLTST